MKVTHSPSAFSIATLTLAIIDPGIYTDLLGICSPHDYVLHDRGNLFLLLVFSSVSAVCLAQHAAHQKPTTGRIGWVNGSQ